MLRWHLLRWSLTLSECFPLWPSSIFQRTKGLLWSRLVYGFSFSVRRSLASTSSSSSRLPVEIMIQIASCSPYAPADSSVNFFKNVTGKFCGKFGGWKFAGFFGTPPPPPPRKIKARNFRGNFGAFFGRKFVTQKTKSFVWTSLCRRATQIASCKPRQAVVSSISTTVTPKLSAWGNPHRFESLPPSNIICCDNHSWELPARPNLLHN